MGKNRKKIIGLVFLFFCFFACLALTSSSESRRVFLTIASAQVSLTNSNTTLIISPTNPSPNQTIYLTIDNPYTDMSRAEITWSLDNIVVLKGVGKKTYSFKTGSLGDVHSIGVVIRTSDGNIIYKDLTIKPSSVDLLWEANTYVPPFYKGKAKQTHESSVKIVAIPEITNSEGVRISPKNLMYRWKKQTGYDLNNSGLGKNTYSLSSPIISMKKRLEVEVSSFDNSNMTKDSLYLINTAPEVLVYENNLLLGMLLNKALTNSFNIENKEVSLSAFPYFFSVSDPSTESLQYVWKMNGKTFEYDKNSVILGANGSSGRSEILVELKNSRRVYQKAKEFFNINF